MLKAEIARRFREALAAAAVSEGWAEPGARAIAIERPRDAAHGDLSSNVAMHWARELHQPPLNVAAAIARAVAPSAPVAAVVVAPPGFLNVRLDDPWLWAALEKRLNAPAPDACAFPPLAAASVAAMRAEAVLAAIARLKASDAEIGALGATRLAGPDAEPALGRLEDGALRFWLLARSPKEPLTLDVALARLESAENPAFSLQHALVRLTDVLATAAAQGLVASAGAESAASAALAAAPARTLLLLTLLTDDEIAAAACTADPARVVRHALALAEAFHRFYVEGRVFGVEPPLAAARLALLAGARRSLELLLGAVGIALPSTF